MTDIVVVDGASQILVGTGGGGALQLLGYSVNGVEIIEDAFMGDVPGDLNGGDLGPPIDIQYFGQIDRVRIEMSQYDPAIMDLIRPRLNGNAPGLIGTPGSLIGAGGFGYRVLILPSSNLRIRNYLLGIPRQPISGNKGTRFSRPILEFECHAVNLGGTVTLWNTASS
jgi:hypothetical protein